jgi:putative Holliday junction resolvase
MKRILALDIGDVWTGSALSDGAGIIAQPYKTVKTTELLTFLRTTITQYKIGHIVVGRPITMKNTESDQTRKVITFTEKLQRELTDVSWSFWDERLTSKWAATQSKGTSSKDKLHSHSIAAAFILDAFLVSRQRQTLSQ